MPGARKEFKGKKTGAKVKCQEQVKNLKEKRREQKLRAKSMESIYGKRYVSRSKMSGGRKDFLGKET
jgi:hypothetical protein